MTDYKKIIRDAARNHINSVGDYPLDNAGMGMYNLDVDLSKIHDKEGLLKSKYDIIVQCHPNGESHCVYLYVYYDTEEGFCDNKCYELDDFDEATQQSISNAYLKTLGYETDNDGQIEVCITFRSKVYIKGNSLSEIKEKWDNLPIFSADALEEHSAEFVEVCSAERVDDNSYDNIVLSNVK